MSRSRSAKEELDRTQAEYDESLTRLREGFDDYKQCVNTYYWRRGSKCSGIFELFHQASVRTSVLEQERNQLASQLPAELNTVQSMHSTCMKEASIIKDIHDLLRKKAPISSLFSGSGSKIFESYTTQLEKCERLKRTQEKLQEESQVKRSEFKK